MTKVILPTKSDTGLSGLLCLKRFWADATIGAMTAVAIIVYFDVFENGFAHFSPGGKELTMDGFHLHRV